MSDIAIRCENISKRYRLGSQEKYKALRDVIANAMAAPFRRNDSASPPTHIWALDDISFEIKRGQVVGVIGHNGGGKSTLLKVLSRITKPTRGSAEINGRVGALLEVGDRKSV